MRPAGHEVARVPSYAECMSSGLRDRAATTLATGVTEPPAPRPRWLRRGRVDLVFVADVVTAFICFAATNSLLRTENAKHGAHYGIDQLTGISLAVCVPLVLRNRYPLTAWTVSAMAMLLASQVIAPGSISGSAYIPAGILVYVLCLYAVAVRCKTWVVAGAGVVTVLGAAFIELQTTFVAVLLGAIPVLAGVIVRSRRGSREQLAVAERRHEGERALLEERQRIARELHDVVAHHMSVIAIQAEAAPYKTENPPPELVESFAEIRASALSGLSELRRVLGVLRSETPATTPQPGLDDLPSLLESARSGGLTVTSGVTGTPRPLPEGVNLSAYRIVQEALSNAMRHAPGSAAQVKLYYGEAALVVEVRNNGCTPESEGVPQQNAGAELSTGSGHGIIGMRERATMLGGYLHAGPTGKGEFLVTAALPLGDGEPEDAP
jgi:signal transduction histidine kinase